MLRKLQYLDWDFRRRIGDQPTATDYLSDFPNDSDLINEVAAECARADFSTLTNAVPATVTDPSRPSHSKNGQDIDSVLAGNDRYELLEEIGRGGIGVVYRRRDRVLGRPVADKVLRENYLHNREARQRFRAEARTCSQLQHPAIIPVYDYERRHDRAPHFVMELVQSPTLAELLKH